VLPRRTRGICGSAPRARTCGKRWARGRAVGPRPGRVDVRGKAGASRAIQARVTGRGRPLPRRARDGARRGDRRRSPAAGPAPVVRPARAPRRHRRCPGSRRSRLPSLPCWYGRGGGARSSRCRCPAAHRRPSIGGWGFGAAPHPGNGAVSTGQPVRSGPGWFGDPRGILRMAWSRWRYPGSAEPGSDRLRDEAPTAAVRAPRRADRRAPRSPRGRRRCSGWA